VRDGCDGSRVSSKALVSRVKNACYRKADINFACRAKINAYSGLQQRDGTVLNR
jgi:hypothetical protein